jgi:hypothetical protein
LKRPPGKLLTTFGAAALWSAGVLLGLFAGLFGMEDLTTLAGLVIVGTGLAVITDLTGLVRIAEIWFGGP